jgi:hypothetical protein
MAPKEQANHVFAAVAGFIARTLDPVRENVGGLIQRADKHGQRLELLERRVAALEKQGGEKARPVSLLKIGER